MKYYCDADPFNFSTQAKLMDISMVSMPDIPIEDDCFAMHSPFDKKKFICLGNIEAPEGFEAVIISQVRKV